MKCKAAIKIFGLLSVILICIFTIGIAQVSAESFEEYVENQQQDLTKEEKEAYSEQQEFARYKEELEKDFEEYKQIVSREFENYKQKILENWEKAEVSTEKTWVEYSSDYRIRRVVNFEDGTIRLEIITDKNTTAKEIESSIKEILTDLITEDQKTAYKRDQLAQNIEKEITQKNINIKSDSVPARSILTKVLTGTDKPSEKQVLNSAAKLQDKAMIDTRDSKLGDKKVVSARTQLPSKTIRKKAEEYRGNVTEYASERNLEPSLVYAIIHTESAFNPMARSYVPAYGLMQIVPESGGKDASRLLFGEPVLLSPSFLYDGRKNINIGTGYLYILYNKYFKEIKSPESRMYCSIAAYNTGPGNVAKTFTKTSNIDKAARVINRMNPEEVYHHMRKNLPYEETRRYLEKVTRRISMYEGI